MKYSEEELLLLSGKEFSGILEKDPILREIKTERQRYFLKMPLLLECLGVGQFRIGDLPVLPLTVAKWLFLSGINSPFVRGEKATLEDADIFLFVLSLPDLREADFLPEDITERAKDFSAATMLSMAELAEEIKAVISSAFSPFRMLPEQPITEKSESVVFDSVWAAEMAGVAARESNMSFDFCLHSMALSLVCAFYVCFLRRNSASPEKFFLRYDSLLHEKIERRSEELAEKFLLSKKEEKI